MSNKALIVKFADRIVNVEDYHYQDPKYAVRYAIQAKVVFDKVLKVYKGNKKIREVYEMMCDLLVVDLDLNGIL